jgi:hypothetical protein
MTKNWEEPPSANNQPAMEIWKGHHKTPIVIGGHGDFYKFDQSHVPKAQKNTQENAHNAIYMWT